MEGSGQTVGGLHENHRRTLWASFLHLDSLVADIETAIRIAESGSPFARYAPDLNPTQQRIVQGYTSQIRARLAKAVSELGLKPARSPVAASWSAETTLHFVLIALEEMSPSRLEGYGALGSDAAQAIERLSLEWRSD